MKKFVLAIAAVGMMASAASAQTYVNGYTRSNGTYVAPHYRSSPNSTTFDNYSTRGNVNPYTGQAGTRSPYANSYAPKPLWHSYVNPNNKVPCYAYCGF